MYQLWFLWFATCSYFLKEDAKGLGTLVFIQWLGLDHFSLATAITPSFFLFRNKEKNIRSYSTHEIQGTKSCYRNVRNILIFFFFFLKWAYLQYGHTCDSDTCNFKSRGIITELYKMRHHRAAEENNYTLCMNNKKVSYNSQQNMDISN